MPSMNVVFTQILVILLYILIGYAAGKLRLIDADQRKYLTTICTNLILPFTILSASNQSIGLGQMAELGLSFALMLGLFIATTALAMLLQRRAPMPTKVTTASLVTYPNCTFLGLPLCRALFGDMAVLYNASAMIAAAMHTPTKITGTALFSFRCSRAATSAPVQAPVPGSGMATRIKSPQLPYFSTTSPFPSARFSKRVISPSNRLQCVLSQAKIRRIKMMMNGTGTMFPRMEEPSATP